MSRDFDPSTPALYHQVSILRPPRTIWERIRACFGVRFFDVETCGADGAIAPITDGRPAPDGRVVPNASAWRQRPGLAD